MFAHASWIEITQTVVAAVGTGFNLWVLTRVVGDLRWIHQTRTNGARRFLIAHHVRAEALRCLVQVTFLLMGVVSLWLPPPGWEPLSGHHEELQPQGVIRTMALMIAAIVLAVSSILDLWDRDTLETYAWDGVERRKTPDDG